VFVLDTGIFRNVGTGTSKIPENPGPIPSGIRIIPEIRDFPTDGIPNSGLFEKPEFVSVIPENPGPNSSVCCSFFFNRRRFNCVVSCEEKNSKQLPITNTALEDFWKKPINCRYMYNISITNKHTRCCVQRRVGLRQGVQEATFEVVSRQLHRSGDQREVPGLPMWRRRGGDNLNRGWSALVEKEIAQTDTYKFSSANQEGNRKKFVCEIKVSDFWAKLAVLFVL
jgi:hypothetical protein